MSAKEIILKPIDSKTANAFVKKNHYSWKVVNNSQLHFWVFYKNILWWVMSYWPSTDKSKLIWLVEGTGWNEFIELNRMAFSELLPKNSESRAIAISIKLLKEKAPHLKWIISFADGCQCGDWTIYRASWFELTAVAKKEKQFYILPKWESFTTITIKLHWYSGAITNYVSHKEFDDIFWSRFNNNANFEKLMEKIWWKEMNWFSLRYIKHLKPNLTRNYEILPYSKIEEMWAKMYKWQKQI